MTIHLDRRRLLHLSAFGAGALVIPGVASAISAGRGFTHDVASGEPSQNSVLLWIRQRSTALQERHRMSVARGTNRLA